MKAKLIICILSVGTAVILCTAVFFSGLIDIDRLSFQSYSVSDSSSVEYQYDSYYTSSEYTASEENSETEEAVRLDGTMPPKAGNFGLVPESRAVDKSYFDDATFVGDSISLKLNYYHASTKCLGEAQFFTAGSMGATNALKEVTEQSVHPSYQGKKMSVEDCIQLSGAKKIYIMLGMNDIGIYSQDKSIENYQKLVNRIREKSPDTDIFIQSITPISSTGIYTIWRNNTAILEYNAKLVKVCETMGWYYIDVNSVLSDENGYLCDDFCSDSSNAGIHLTNKGCEQWVDCLLKHTIDFN